MQSLTLVPAYGRDYKSQREVTAAWKAGKDFRIQQPSSPHDGRYTNINDFPVATTASIRYAKLTKVMLIKPGK